MPKRKTGVPSAVEKLALGNLSYKAITGTQGLGAVDLDKFVLTMKDTFSLSAVDLVTDATITRTIEGASTLTVDLLDEDRAVLQSGKIARGLDVNIDGLFFRLTNPKKAGDYQTLVFEDRVVNVMRKYAKKLGPISRNKMTRAQFILSMLNEVQEFVIPYFIPEMNFVQPVGKNANLNTFKIAAKKQGGIASGSGKPVPSIAPPGNVFNPKDKIVVSDHLTVKGAPMSDEQIKVSNQILETGKRLGARRKVLVVAIMTAIQESSITNMVCKADPGSPIVRCGVYRQDPRYWPASRDVAKDATEFYKRAMGYDRETPSLARYLLAEAVQHSGVPLAYAPHNYEADRIVTAFGVTGGDNEGVASTPGNSGSGNDFFFYRGKPPAGAKGWGKEDTWTCIQRLADEVQWRAFMLGTEFFYVSEEYLFRSAEAMVLDESTDGIDVIDYDADENKAYATVTVAAHMKRWAAPPGCVLRFRNMGPVNGRYLVTEVTRGLFNDLGTITCKKPQIELPEPPLGNLTQAGGTRAPQQSGRRFRVPGALIQPIPRGLSNIINGKNHGPIHDTMGLPGYRALDFFANAGTPVLAVEDGTIQQWRGTSPEEGPPLGQGGPLGYSIYMAGKSGTMYYYTHLDQRNAAPGAKVTVGQIIGTVCDWSRWGGIDHVHLGVHPGQYTIEQVQAAKQATSA